MPAFPTHDGKDEKELAEQERIEGEALLRALLEATAANKPPVRGHSRQDREHPQDEWGRPLR